jgi:hypothetical protein
MVDMMGYELSFEQTQLHAANQALNSGHVWRALGHLRTLAAYLGIELPPRPLPKPSAYETALDLENYYFRCSSIIGDKVCRKLETIRRSYNPISIKVKEKVKGDNGPARA